MLINVHIFIYVDICISPDIYLKVILKEDIINFEPECKYEDLTENDHGRCNTHV